MCIRDRNSCVPLYDENDLLTFENIEKIKLETNSSELPVWKLIESNFDIIEKLLNKAKRTLTYNDFYYTNLIVAQNRTSAMMFDYNLLGKGYAYAAIRHVCFSLSEVAKKAFLEEYGKFDISEMIIDNVVSILTTCLLYTSADGRSAASLPWGSAPAHGRRQTGRIRR